MVRLMTSRWGLVALCLALAGVISAGVFWGGYRAALRPLAERGQVDLALAADSLTGALQRYRELAVVLADHPQVREAVNELAKSGVRIGTLVSDIPTVLKVGYVGIDNRAAGRLAGLLLGLRIEHLLASPQVILVVPWPVAQPAPEVEWWRRIDYVR